MRTSNEHEVTDVICFTRELKALPLWYLLHISINLKKSKFLSATVWRISNENMHAGYAKIVSVDNHLNILTHNPLSMMDNNDSTVQTVAGPAMRSECKLYSNNLLKCAKYKTGDCIEFVFATHCPIYPTNESDFIRSTKALASPQTTLLSISNYADVTSYFLPVSNPTLYL